MCRFLKISSPQRKGNPCPNAMVVYGHTPIAELEWLNCTINIDTGCVFG
ncbi:MAG TPA: hypothetical protein VMH04_12095 [Candidatus Solibacter sp.]|jgi:diadenosine tetraphosphatase ApaH/serine/threonine PP2A family protein phosphatase|nr:hypothetical protein [Candidatus Solibacter sp.]